MGGKKGDKGPGLVTKLVRLVVVLGVLALLLEVGGRLGASVAAERAIVATGRAASADVTVGAQPWRPALLPTLTGAPLDQVKVELTDVKVEYLTVDAATYQLDDVQLSFSISTRPVAIESIGSGSVRLELSPGSLAAVLGTPVSIADGKVLVGPDRVPARLEVVDGILEVDAPGLEFTTLPVDDPDLLMCPPTVSVDGDRVVLSCAGNRVPALLTRALDPPDPGGRPGGPTNVGPPNSVTAPPPSALPDPAGQQQTG
ncbi:MAG: hypothetical protein ACKO04_09915 [Actinomycetes bacterium]